MSKASSRWTRETGTGEDVQKSWAECERHARAILGDDEFERRFGEGAQEAAPAAAVTQGPARPVQRLAEVADGPLFVWTKKGEG